MNLVMVRIRHTNTQLAQIVVYHTAEYGKHHFRQFKMQVLHANSHDTARVSHVGNAGGTYSLLVRARTYPHCHEACQRKAAH